MSKDLIWRIGQHTLAKHALLRRYLSAWFPILAAGGRNRRLVFVDAFAGPGIYKGGEPGSPIVALQALVDRSDFYKYSEVEFLFIFVEANPETYTNLSAQIDTFWSNRPRGKPDNVRTLLINDTFTGVVDQILAHLRDRDQRLAPVLAFLDPFGWKDAPMATIKSLVSLGKSEILFTFMYDSVTRFVTVEEVAQSFNDLFGNETAEYREFASLHGEERKTGLRDYYTRRLKGECGFNFVRTFEVVDTDRGRTAYFLIFGTRSIKGLEKMKDAMWTLDPITGIRFTGFAGDQRVLFDPEPDKGPLKMALLKHFAGKTVSVNDIERFVLVDTDYKSTHYKSVLKELEGCGSLKYISGRKRSGGYPPGTILQFDCSLDGNTSALSTESPQEALATGNQRRNVEESSPLPRRLPGF